MDSVDEGLSLSFRVSTGFGEGTGIDEPLTPAMRGRYSSAKKGSGGGVASIRFRVENSASRRFGLYAPVY